MSRYSWLGLALLLVAPPLSAEEPGESIFNDQLRRFKFAIEGQAVTIETAEEFMVRYQRPDNPRIIGAYPNAKTNSLIVIGPPEAEQAIRESLAQWIVDVGGAPSLDIQLRVLQHDRAHLLVTMAHLEVQEIDVAAEENGVAKAKQLAAKRQTIEEELKTVEQQIRVVRKYMARLEEDESAPASVASP